MEKSSSVTVVTGAFDIDNHVHGAICERQTPGTVRVLEVYPITQAGINCLTFGNLQLRLAQVHARDLAVPRPAQVKGSSAHSAPGIHHMMVSLNPGWGNYDFHHALQCSCMSVRFFRSLVVPGAFPGLEYAEMKMLGTPLEIEHPGHFVVVSYYRAFVFGKRYFGSVVQGRSVLFIVTV